MVSYLLGDIAIQLRILHGDVKLGSIEALIRIVRIAIASHQSTARFVLAQTFKEYMTNNGLNIIILSLEHAHQAIRIRSNQERAEFVVLQFSIFS
jgi:hypothetical protein